MFDLIKSFLSKHMFKKIAAANKVFHYISRLINTEKDLFFQVFKKLYIACIISIADYEISIWWKNQQFLLNKFEKLQNSVLRKILETFRIFSIAIMKIKAEIASILIRFKKICKNYALRIL